MKNTVRSCRNIFVSKNPTRRNGSNWGLVFFHITEYVGTVPDVCSLRDRSDTSIVKGDIIFCATGVTSGDLASGVKDLGNEFEVNTFVNLIFFL